MSVNNIPLEYIEIGKIVKPFGVKGELKVLFYIDDPSDLKNVKSFYVKDKKEVSGYRELSYSSLKFSENPEHAKVFFTDIPDRTSAEMWRLVPLFIKKEFLSVPDEGSYFVKDLIDLDAYYQSEKIGTIFNLFEVANQEIFVIRQINTKLDLAVPFNDYYVSSISLDDKIIVFNHLDELL